MLRRLAAIVALIVPIAMIVVAAVALAGDVPIAVLAVGLGLVANGAIWFALTERGMLRVFGAVAAILATAGLIVVLATHWQGLLVLIGLLAAHWPWRVHARIRRGLYGLQGAAVHRQ
ncbi:MAG: hypothetical protein ACLQMH_15865 [Solirubrobacteraceae bacterium]